MKRIYLLILSVVIMITNTFSQSAKPVFVLIHGAWFGSFAWKKVTPLLEAKGYRVIVLDLPGYGDDKRPSATITLADYVNKVADTIKSLKGNVVLVGHSMAGAIISEVGELLGPEKIDKLVFLDAFLLKNGESILAQVGKINEARGAAANPAIQSDYLVFSEDGKSCMVPPGRMQDVFCHDCLPEDLALLRTHTTWQPVAALATPVILTDKRFGSIPKFYIHCTQSRDLDRTSILHNVSCQKIYTLPSSHSPFFSMPGKLVEIFDQVMAYQ